VVFARRIAAELEEVDRVCSELRQDALRAVAWNHRFAVELLLREALTNAVLYGAKCNARRTIACEIECLGCGVALRVCDDGDGFPWRQLLEAAAPPLSESGRGLQILRLYSTALTFNEEGNQVEIIRMFDQGEGDGKL